jgi:hypothetical protein
MARLTSKERRRDLSRAMEGWSVASIRRALQRVTPPLPWTAPFLNARSAAARLAPLLSANRLRAAALSKILKRGFGAFCRKAAAARRAAALARVAGAKSRQKLRGELSKVIDRWRRAAGWRVIKKQIAARLLGAPRQLLADALDGWRIAAQEGAVASLRCAKGAQEAAALRLGRAQEYISRQNARWGAALASACALAAWRHTATLKKIAKAAFSPSGATSAQRQRRALATTRAMAAWARISRQNSSLRALLAISLRFRALRAVQIWRQALRRHQTREHISRMRRDAAAAAGAVGRDLRGGRVLFGEGLFQILAAKSARRKAGAALACWRLHRVAARRMRAIQNLAAQSRSRCAALRVVVALLKNAHEAKREEAAALERSVELSSQVNASAADALTRTRTAAAGAAARVRVVGVLKACVWVWSLAAAAAAGQARAAAALRRRGCGAAAARAFRIWARGAAGAAAARVRVAAEEAARGSFEQLEARGRSEAEALRLAEENAALWREVEALREGGDAARVRRRALVRRVGAVARRGLALLLKRRVLKKWRDVGACGRGGCKHEEELRRADESAKSSKAEADVAKRRMEDAMGAAAGGAQERMALQRVADISRERLRLQEEEIARLREREATIAAKLKCAEEALVVLLDVNNSYRRHSDPLTCGRFSRSGILTLEDLKK